VRFTANSGLKKNYILYINGGEMKILRMCFLALLLFLISPVHAQEYDYDVPEMEDEVEEELTEATEEEAEAEKLEEAVETEEEMVQEDTEEKEELVEKMAEEKQPEKVEEVETAAPSDVKPEVSVAVEVAEEKEEEGEDEKSDKKFRLSVTNGFAHGLAKERKNFGYNLNLGLSYSLPWKLNFNAGVGLRVSYRYGMVAAASPEDGMISDVAVDHASFDGTPLTMSLSRPFPLFWDIGGSLGVTVVLPFTSTMLWEQYNIYTMLGANLGIRRPFKVAKETTLTAGFGFNYQKTFAKYDFAWDDYQNIAMDFVNEHEFGLGLNLSLGYKAVSLSVGGGYSITKPFSNVLIFIMMIINRKQNFRIGHTVLTFPHHLVTTIKIGILQQEPRQRHLSLTVVTTQVLMLTQEILM
jgi:hypothetical protein